MSMQWRAKQLADGTWEGMVSFTPIANAGKFKAGKTVKLSAKAKTQAKALAKASSVADAIINNPILKAALPPGSSTAIKAIKYLSKSAVKGKLKKAAKKIIGKGAKRLAKALGKWSPW